VPSPGGAPPGRGRGRSGASIPCLKMNLNNAAQRRTTMIAKDFIMAKDK
jgi:hypothetical protein